MNLNIPVPTQHYLTRAYLYTQRCVYFHTANKEMTKTEIHPDHSIMTKIKSFNTKLKENPKINSFKKNKKKIPNV